MLSSVKDLFGDFRPAPVILRRAASRGSIHARQYGLEDAGGSEKLSTVPANLGAGPKRRWVERGLAKLRSGLRFPQGAFGPASMHIRGMRVYPAEWL
jgi:hypothetical protein